MVELEDGLMEVFLICSHSLYQYAMFCFSVVELRTSLNSGFGGMYLTSFQKQLTKERRLKRNKKEEKRRGKNKST